MLMGNAVKGGPPPELQVTLSSLQAPKCSRHQEKVDEVRPVVCHARRVLTPRACTQQDTVNMFVLALPPAPTALHTRFRG